MSKAPVALVVVAGVREVARIHHHVQRLEYVGDPCVSATHLELVSPTGAVRWVVPVLGVVEARVDGPGVRLKFRVAAAFADRGGKTTPLDFNAVFVVDGAGIRTRDDPIDGKDEGPFRVAPDIRFSGHLSSSRGAQGLTFERHGWSPALLSFLRSRPQGYLQAVATFVPDSAWPAVQASPHGYERRTLQFAIQLATGQAPRFDIKDLANAVATRWLGSGSSSSPFTWGNTGVVSYRQVFVGHGGEVGSGNTWRVTFPLVPGQVVLDWWNEAVVNRVTRGITVVRDDNRLTFLPRLYVSDPARTGEVAFQVHESVSPAVVLATDNGAAPRYAPGHALVQLHTVRLAAGIEVRAEWPHVVDVDGNPLRAGLRTREAVPASAATPALFAFDAVGVAADGAEAARWFRMGALELEFADAFAADEMQPPLHLESSLPARGGPEFEFARRHARLRLPVRGVRPGSQDPLPAAISAKLETTVGQGVLVPLSEDAPLQASASSPWAARGELKVDDLLVAEASQEVVAQLYLDRQGLPKVRALVIDPAPFMLAVVSQESSLPDAQSSIEVANWSHSAGRRANWEIDVGAAAFQLLLPPQGVGEAMHRRRADRDIVPDAPASFRLTIPTRIELATGTELQRFVEPPWNVRRALIAGGTTRSGVRLREITTELLYGVVARVRPEDTRFGELAVRLGYRADVLEGELRWPGTDAQRLAWRAKVDDWRRVGTAVQHRLALLQPWRGDEVTWTSRPGEPLRHVLRRRTSLRPPVTVATPDGKLPEGFATDGLPGGYAWPFESAAVFERLLDQRDGGAGDIAITGFSALGGWGRQRAVFGLTTIDAQISMGRVERIAVSRLGRIGLLWNRAKHVIVYERRVAPTEQFAPQQHPLAGSPVLRKVEEYVELIDADHTFASEADAAPVEHGCVLGARFFDGRPPRIRVDSLWGRDVRLGTRRAWVVPLWRPTADPAVYPRPNIALELAGRGTDASVLQTLREPDRLVFFTETTDDRDPREWAPFPGIDTVIAPPPAVPEPVTTSDPELIAGPQAESVVRGYADFTFAVEPGDSGVDVVAARAARPVLGELHNVVMSRGAIVRAVSDALGTGIETAATQLARGRADGVAALAKGPGAAIETVKACLRVAADALPAAAIPAVDRVRERLADAIARRTDGFAQDTLAQWLAELGRQARFDRDPPSMGELLPRLRAQYRDALARLRAGEFEPVRLPYLFDTVVQAAVVAESGITTALDLMIERIDTVLDATEPIEPGEPAIPVAELGDLLAGLATAVDTAVGAWSSCEAPMYALGAFFVRDCAMAWWSDGRRVPLETMLREVSLRATAGMIVPDAGKVARAQLVAVRDRLAAERAAAAAWFEAVHTLIEERRSELTSLLDAADRVGDLVADLFEPLFALVEPKLDDVRKKVEDWLNPLQAQIGTRWREFTSAIGAAAAAAGAHAHAGLGRLADTIRALAADEEWHRVLDRLPRAAAVRTIETFVARAEAVLGAARGVAENVAQVGDVGTRALQLVRALGRPPAVPGLDFGPLPKPGEVLPAIAYHFRDSVGRLLEHVRTTPIAAYANRVVDRLKPVQLVLPVTGIGDVLQFPPLSNFDVGKLFRDLAGLPLAQLMPALRLPEIADERVRITHGLDPQSRSGWVQADADVPFGSRPLTLLDLPVLAIRLRDARFTAVARIEADGDGRPRQTVRGSILADWELVLAGLHLCTFERCALRFDERGRLELDLSPDRVRLHGVLAFLGDLLRKVTGKSGAELIVDERGVTSRLAVAVPDVRLGTFGLTNLRVGVEFGLEVTSGFVVRSGLTVGRREAPFTLTVFVLGGAGYFETSIKYPVGQTAVVVVAIGIFAAASLAIDLGIVRGGVSVYLGITVDYRSVAESKQPRGLAIGVQLVISGELSLLGIVHVQLVIGLELIYLVGPPARFRGRGYVRLKIKVFWFLTIEVAAEVECEFGGDGDTGAPQVAGPAEAVTGGAVRPASLAASSSKPPTYEYAAAAYQDMFA
ncbi:MAG: hypothetical protein MUC36_18270 [Planctomycetes bacterium]|nr:hypothetical protein [Planctomycetota bacterium]